MALIRCGAGSMRALNLRGLLSDIHRCQMLSAPLPTLTSKAQPSRVDGLMTLAAPQTLSRVIAALAGLACVQGACSLSSLDYLQNGPRQDGAVSDGSDRIDTTPSTPSPDTAIRDAFKLDWLAGSGGDETSAGGSGGRTTTPDASGAGGTTGLGGVPNLVDAAGGTAGSGGGPGLDAPVRTGGYVDSGGDTSVGGSRLGGATGSGGLAPSGGGATSSGGVGGAATGAGGHSGGNTSVGGSIGLGGSRGGATSNGGGGGAATGGQAGAGSGGAATGGKGVDAGAGGAATGGSGGADAAAETGIACAGPSRGGICWYLGPQGSSCQQVCASHGQLAPGAVGHVGTPSQGGSLAECGILLGLLGISGTPTNGARSDGLGLGCHVYNAVPWWLSSPNFSASAAHASASLVCGCTQ
jgi:hypothetical protein